MQQQSSQTLEPLDPARRYDVPTACRYLGISRPWLYRKVERGDLKLIRDGRRTFVAGTDIARLCQAPA